MNGEQHIDTADGALIYLDNAKQEIESANDLLTLKEIHDKLSAVKVFCKAAKVSFEITQRCSELKIRCERRAGELLNGREKHPPGPSPQDRSHVATYPPKLEDLDITKSQSSRWQSIAAVPDGDFEKKIDEIKKGGREITSSEMLSFSKYLDRERERTERRRAAAEEASAVEPDQRIRIFHGDFREVLTAEVVPTDSVSLVLTDPMYGREHLPQWAELAQFASRVLKTGNLLVAYSGQTYLPEVLNALEEHLTYVWVAGVRYSYPNNIFPLRIKNSLKLLLLFAKGAYDPGPTQFWLHDLINGDDYPETKRESELQQGCKEAEYLIETLTHPGDLVVDPFTGTGTVAVAAKRKGRRFIGAELSKERYNLALSRIAQEERV
jgi:hypothetical protein